LPELVGRDRPQALPRLILPISGNRGVNHMARRGKEISRTWGGETLQVCYRRDELIGFKVSTEMISGLSEYIGRQGDERRSINWSAALCQRDRLEPAEP